MWGVARTLSSKGKLSGMSGETPATANPQTASTVNEGENEEDKSKKKVISGTPDKPPSPLERKNNNDVIDGEEIQKLAIKDEDLKKLHLVYEKSPETNKEPTSANFVVRRVKTSELPVQKPTKRIVVARPAPPGAQLKPLDYTGPSGPSYMPDGRIVPYSLLGTVENFVGEAIKRSDMRPDSPAAVEIPYPQPQRLKVKRYERPRSVANEKIPTAINQERALVHWRKKMADRKRQQGYISNLLEKPLDRLVMNQDVRFRSMQERRRLVDRAIPAIDYGKGYRVGSEFWRQHESFGDDLTGIKMTLTKTERGSPMEFEHIGKPWTVQHEVGTRNKDERPTVDPRRTWHSSQYLRTRTQQLQPILNELDPYRPDLNNLEVIGNLEGNLEVMPGTEGYQNEDMYGNQEPEYRNPLDKYPDVIVEPMSGPSIIFAGHQAGWLGSSNQNKGKVGLETRITFEAGSNERCSQYLTVENNGTTAIYYEWTKVPKVVVFEAMKADLTQRFYFNTGEGVVLPGDTRKFPFIFKSRNAGIFTETWRLTTKPAVLGGASLQVVLKGVALEDEGVRRSRSHIEQELEQREARVCVRNIIEEIVKSIKSPDRPPSPVDAYITEQELFERKNGGRFYDHETVNELKNIYLQLFTEEDREDKEWDLSLDDLQSCINLIPDEDAKEELLSGVNTVINKLSNPPLTPAQQRMYAAGYRLWQAAIDNISGCSMLVRNIMGLPEVVMTETFTEPEPSNAAVAPAQSKPDPKVFSAKSLGSQSSNQGKNEKKGKGKKSTGKDGKDDKGKKGGKKERPKSKGKGGKQPAPSPTKELSTERDLGSKTPSSVRTVQADTLDPVTRKKYTEKMYSQVYNLLVEMVDSMTLAFEDAELES